MRELIHVVKAAYPHDDFFVGVDASLRYISQARSFYRAYDRAMSYLDPESWKELTCKAVTHFKDHREGQLKQGFFNQLNDVFAYQFLIRRGCSRVSVLQENSKSTPDLEYYIGNTRYYCEVKTIGLSQDEVARRGSGSIIDGAIYLELSEGFLRKLDDTLLRAQKQISEQTATGLVFLIINFDDLAKSHYDRYLEQLSAFLCKHEVPNVYVKVDLTGGRYFEKGQFTTNLF